ncbi:GDSL-type esterase/lipase family protein [Sphingomonas pituitosa]|uniref:GDSL-type esterase/lipase family protein n=1 Tax=Sphingomonas pituitosa TaxID=99597 RepID=UPI000831AA9C|nr:GDSL-type esterase/lipase family protein [Sphingomonas pituitosa]
MIAALIAAMLLQTAAPLAQEGCSRSLCDADRLAPVFEKLATARKTARTVRIIQIGDSHTAADQVTGSWRTLLQARFGAAGRGVLPPGRPYAGYLTRNVTATQTGTWVTSGIFGAAWHPDWATPIGLSGYSLTSAAPGAAMGLRADDSTQRFGRFTVCALTGPGAGAVMLTLGTEQRSWSLAAPVPGSDCTTVETQTPSASAALVVTQGVVTITSWATEAPPAGGVTLSNLGTVGAQFLHYDRTDEAVMARELAAYRPDLLVLAFGTNEAFYPRFTAGGYAEQLSAGIARLQRLAPGVPILLVGAPDSATRLASLQGGAGGVSPPCPGLDPADPWRPTAALATVQAIQRRIAHQRGIAYWDWSTSMGGRCTATDWATRQPPLMRGDHVHFTTQGAAEIARRLEEDLEDAMAPSRSEPRTNATTSPNR